MSPAWWSPVVSNRSQRSILLASNTATRDLQRGNVATASLAADPIRGAAQNLVGRGKACSVGYAGVGRLGLLQCLVGVDQTSWTRFALCCSRIDLSRPADQWCR